MTKEEILAMEVGLEIDMLVGQYVIGFEDYLKETGKRPVVRDGRYLKNYFDLPNYSTDITAAWEVVEKMKSEYFVRITVEEDSSNCTIRDYGDRRNHIYDVTRESITEAICKAALLAVMDS